MFERKIKMQKEMDENYQKFASHQASLKRKLDSDSERHNTPVKKKSNNRGSVTRKMPKLEDDESVGTSPKKDEEDYYFNYSNSATELEGENKGKKLKKRLSDIS